MPPLVSPRAHPVPRLPLQFKEGAPGESAEDGSQTISRRQAEDLLANRNSTCFSHESSWRLYIALREG